MRQKTAVFRFYEELNDFLAPERRKVESVYRFRNSPGIKDPIEALGVPHTEVDLILVNGESVGFGHRLADGDRVSVYPVFEAFDIASLTRLRHAPLRRTAFIADVNLGKLARCLRLPGFDCLYSNRYRDAEVVRIALDERRIILTRDRRLLHDRRITHGAFIHADEPNEQVRELIRRFQLVRNVAPFNRCLDCNGIIRPVAKPRIQDRLPPKTRLYYDRFFQCLACEKVYWKGPHFGKMLDRIDRLIP